MINLKEAGKNEPFCRFIFLLFQCFLLLNNLIFIFNIFIYIFVFLVSVPLLLLYDSQFKDR
eukprot:gene10904-7562_t